MRTQDVETQPRLWISEINRQMGSTAGKDWMTTSGQRAHRPFAGNIPSSSGRTNINRKLGHLPNLPPLPNRKHFLDQIQAPAMCSPCFLISMAFVHSSSLKLTTWCKPRWSAETSSVANLMKTITYVKSGGPSRGPVDDFVVEESSRIHQVQQPAAVTR